MSSSTSSEDDFTPLGIGLLNISKGKSASVMVQKVEEEKSDLPSVLQYLSLLSAAMEILNKSRESDGERMKLALNVIRRGRKTYINLVEIANQLHRQPEHLAFFVSKDLLTEGTVNKDGQMILNGMFLQSGIEGALRHFIEAYVLCKSCESVEDTFIAKENKLFFLKCNRCKGSRCVGNSIEGFTFKDKPQQKLK